jgi:ketosteroid isomerase-like protein
MSQENVEIVRHAFEAFNRGDLAGAVADWAPDAEYRATGGHMTGLAGLYRGPDAYRTGFLEPFVSEFDEPRLDIHELIDTGDHVVAALTVSGRGKRSEAEVAWDVWQVWTLRDGQIIRGHGYGSRDEAFAAVGLSE